MSRAATSTTGVWSRRPAVDAPDEDKPGGKRWGAADIVDPVPPPANVPTPFGDLSRATIEDLTRVACSVLPRSDIQLDKRRRSIRRMAEHLSRFPGDTWQQRWDASGFGAGGSRIGELNPAKTASWTMTSGFSWLAAMRVIVPSLRVLVRDVVYDYAPIFVACQQDTVLDQIVDRISQAPTSEPQKHRARYELAVALTSLAIPAGDLTPAGLVHFGLAFRDTRTGKNSHERKLAGSLIWQVQHGLGLFPDGTPPTMRVALVGGKKSVAELVDTYGIVNPAIREVIIDYIGHRAALGMDYSTTASLVRSLVRNFWCVIERLDPAQDSLELSEALYESWRREVDTVTTSEGPKPRRGIWDLLIAVRAFYLDIQSWALEDPGRWGQWVARCPIPPTASRGYAAERRRLSERVADRTRLRQPLLEALVDHVAERHEYAAGLLRAARRFSGDADFLFRDVRYEQIRDASGKGQFPQKGPRALRTTDSTPIPPPSRKLRVRTDEGKVLEPEIMEERAFWVWAVVEVLRLTGIRHEELLEISHVSIRQYRRSNGETIGLLVITPSKTDRERVIPMSPELLHVMARLILRHVNELGHVPLLRRWDPHEREHSEPLPFLFQHSIGAVRTLWSAGSIGRMLRDACAQLAASNPAFRDLHFTPHDFRRIFATDLVNNGLPIHIGAALLGHNSLQTTRGYVAVFDEDVVRHYQLHLAKRRALRPKDEYRPPTADEWGEFDSHFDKRRVELGSCGRPYGTPCQHEHACVRCGMLQIEPEMLPRLARIEADLIARRARAEQEQWFGEIEGLDLTLLHLRDKRQRTQRLERQPVRLPMPVVKLAVPTIETRLGGDG